MATELYCQNGAINWQLCGLTTSLNWAYMYRKGTGVVYDEQPMHCGDIDAFRKIINQL